MKTSLIIVLVASCVSFLPAQERSAAEVANLETELKTLHSTIRALKRSQAAQQKTFNIMATRLDSIAGAVKATHLQASQTVDSVARLSKTQSDYSLKLQSFEDTLDVRSALLIVALLALGALSLIVFFTLKKAIVEASQIVLEQATRPSSFTVKKQEPRQASAFVVEPHQKRTPVTLPIEPELFEAVQKHAEAEAAPTAPAPVLHGAIAAMIAPEEQPAAKTASHCHGVTKAGSQCKRKPVAGTRYCSQHTK